MYGLETTFYLYELSGFTDGLLSVTLLEIF